MTSLPPQEASKEFIITREFNAPRRLVWRAWTDPDQLKIWFGPKGFTMTRNDMNLRPGGLFHYCLQGPEGNEMWGKFIYREIVAPELLVLVNSFSDPSGGTSRHPMSPTWPLEMLSVATLAEHGGRTALTLRWAPLNPTTEERSTFAKSHEGMKHGWATTFDQLADYLATF